MEINDSFFKNIYVGRVANRTSDRGLNDRLLDHICQYTELHRVLSYLWRINDALRNFEKSDI